MRDNVQRWKRKDGMKVLKEWLKKLSYCTFKTLMITRSIIVKHFYALKTPVFGSIHADRNTRKHDINRFIHLFPPLDKSLFGNTEGIEYWNYTRCNAAYLCYKGNSVHRRHSAWDNEKKIPFYIPWNGKPPHLELTCCFASSLSPNASAISFCDWYFNGRMEARPWRFNE